MVDLRASLSTTASHEDAAIGLPSRSAQPFGAFQFQLVQSGYICISHIEWKIDTWAVVSAVHLCSLVAGLALPSISLLQPTTTVATRVWTSRPCLFGCVPNTGCRHLKHASKRFLAEGPVSWPACIAAGRPRACVAHRDLRTAGRVFKVRLAYKVQRIRWQTCFCRQP